MAHVTLRQLTDVRPRDERLGTRAGEDHRLDGGVRSHLFDQVTQFGDDGGVERVELVGAVDGDGRNGVRRLKQQCLVHGG
jgi:hypothetical protein